SRIGSAIANRDYAEVEAAWRELASLDPEEAEYLLSVAGQLQRFDKSTLAGELCLSLAETLLEKGDNAGALAAAKASLKASQRTEGLRELLSLTYSAHHKESRHLTEFLEKSGLSGESGSLRQQVDALDRYLTFEEGAFVFHAGGWGYGVVAEFDPSDEQMVVDFQRRKGHGISLFGATKILQRLSEEHIGVYMHFRRDELDAMIKEDPAKVFHIFLQSYGGKATLKQVREKLVPEILEKAEWTRWWGRAKKALLKDPEVRLGKGSSPLLELRDKAKSIEQEVVEKMQAHTSGLEKVAVAREYLRTLDLTPQLSEAVGAEVEAALAAEKEEKSSSRLALLYLNADLKRVGSEDARTEARLILGEAEDQAGLVTPLELADRKRAVQDLADAAAPGWAEALTHLLRSGDTEVADSILEQLKHKRPDILIAFFAELTAKPRQNPVMFLWYVRGFMHGTIPMELAPGEKESSVMEKLLTLANQVGLDQRRSGDAELKEFLRHMRSFLTARRLKIFKAFVAKTSLDYARFLFGKIQRNRGFTDQTRQALLDVIEAEHPDIHTSPDEEPTGEVALSDDVIHTTLKGYHKKEAELRQLLEVEIPENAADLGRAAKFGDISENAEYSAALEKQDRIMRSLRELRDNLDRARILDPEFVTTEAVVIGTLVRLKNLSRDEEEAFSILGPWDVDLGQGIISYLSPVGRGLLGKRKGATTRIELPEGSVEYSLLDIQLAPSLAPTDE
ncbi:MAG: GreA/GreB family elongation factor, partial [Planctomycetota bacterium]